MTELLARRADLDGVFVASDLMASGALEVLRAAAGRQVPQDVAVVGFDDSPIALMTEPTAHQRPPVAGGHRAGSSWTCSSDASRPATRSSAG